MLHLTDDAIHSLVMTFVKCLQHTVYGANKKHVDFYVNILV